MKHIGFNGIYFKEESETLTKNFCEKSEQFRQQNLYKNYEWYTLKVGVPINLESIRDDNKIIIDKKRNKISDKIDKIFLDKWFNVIDIKCSHSHANFDTLEDIFYLGGKRLKGIQVDLNFNRKEIERFKIKYPNVKLIMTFSIFDIGYIIEKNPMFYKYNVVIANRDRETFINSMSQYLNFIDYYVFDVSFLGNISICNNIVDNYVFPNEKREIFIKSINDIIELKRNGKFKPEIVLYGKNNLNFNNIYEVFKIYGTEVSYETDDGSIECLKDFNINSASSFLDNFFSVYQNEITNRRN